MATPTSFINGNQPVYPLYNTTTGGLTLVNSYEFSVCVITGTQQIQLLGSARLVVI